MGDAGSQFLGFLAICLSLKLTGGNTPLSHLIPLMILGLPVLDTLWVMTERIRNGRSPFAADKNHLHHKLMALGLYHNEAVIVIYFLQAILVTCAFVFRFHSEWVLLISYLLFCVLIFSAFLSVKTTGWEFKHRSFIDVAIKGRFRFLKEQNILIMVSFKFLQAGLPVLLFTTCLLAGGVQRTLSLFPLERRLLCFWSGAF